MQCFYERRWRERKDDSANSDSNSDYNDDINVFTEDEEEGNANFIDDDSHVL